MAIILAPQPPFRFDGQRPNNEDAYWPASPDAHTRLFIICDGMGGWDRGEVASQLVAETVAGYVGQHPVEHLDPEYLQEAIAAAQHSLTDYLAQHPLVSRLGTTLAMLYLDEQSVSVAHIGDSRVYQIRDGQILFRTQDHRQVLDLVREGIISPEQARTHPWRNRLSRSLSAEAPTGADKLTRRSDHADLTHLTDIQPDDYFFMCTDGVQEQVSDELLADCLAGDQPDADKLARLLTYCEGRTQDNYTGFLLRVADVQPASRPDNDPDDADTREPGEEPDLPATSLSWNVWRWLGLTYQFFLSC